MSPVETTMPPATKAGILRKVASSKHPKLELPSIASNYQLTLVELQALLGHHGYPDPRKMVSHAERLEQDTQAPEPSPGDDEHAEHQAADDAAADTLGTLTRVPVNRLLADPNNLREHLTDIEDLAASIKEAGLLEPILARTEGQRLYVVAGHRRLAAVRLLRWTAVPTIIRPSMRSDSVIMAMLIENGQRVDLDPIEEARGLFKVKTERGCSDLELGAMIGRSGAYVANRLAFMHLTPEQQDEVRAGNMTLGEATHRGRQNSGTLGKTGVDRNWHLGPQHTLSNRAKARCHDAGHSRGRTVGGMACGECWESVIRADERVRLVQRSIRKGQCDTCGGLVKESSGGGS